MGVVDAVWLTAFVGGILTFIAPCFLPIVPGYIGYIAGVERTVTLRRAGHALAFTAGFTLVFALFGAGVGVLGEWLVALDDEIRIGSAALLVVFGVLMLNIVPLPVVMRDIHIPFFTQNPEKIHASFVRSGAVGVVFAFGWTPCTGPVLGSILTLAYGFGDWERSTLLLTVYGLGLGVPFVASALLMDTLLRPLRKTLLSRGIWIQRVAGIVLILFAAALFTDSFSRLSLLFE